MGRLMPPLTRSICFVAILFVASTAGGGGGGDGRRRIGDIRVEQHPLIRPADPPPYYTCPPSFESPPVLVRPNRTVRLLVAPSDPGSLCTLVRVTFTTRPNGESGRNILAPVGRSYNGRSWERVAGPYKSAVGYECSISSDVEGYTRSTGTLCEVALPALESPNQAFVLLTYNHTLSGRNTVARFLQQTTFGPTKAEIDSLDQDGADLDLSFAEWLHDQIYVVPRTSHREFWRRRIRQRFDSARPIGRPMHPCERHSRWRDVAFTEWDVGKIVTVNPLVASSYAEGSQGVNIPYVLYVDGNLRTVVDSLHFGDYSYQYGIDLAHGYEICVMPEPRIGGSLVLKQPDGSCREVYGGNMQVGLKDSVIETTPGIMIVDLPSLDEGDIIGIGDDGTNNGWMLASDIIDQDQCGGIPMSGSTAPVFGRLPSNADGDGESAYLLHDPFLKIMNNTLDSPLKDGGGALVQSTGGTTMCSNAPRTFVNREQCRLSNDPSTCSSKHADALNIALTLDHETILQLSSLSGQYIYSIGGLRVETGDVLSPCIAGTRSRWMKVGEGDKTFSCGNDPVLHPDTASVLSNLIASSNDENPSMRDIFFPEESEDNCDESDSSIVGMQVNVEGTGTCWKHVHQDHNSVYDFTYWAGETAHPGNAVRKQRNEPNPIKAPFELESSATLIFPSHHTMDRWSTFKPDFQLIGRLGDSIDFRDLPDGLRISSVAEGFGAVLSDNESKATLVCGSPGEVSNDPSVVGPSFDVTIDRDVDLYSESHYTQQRKTAWTTIAMSARDQLAQRMAWALSQILVVSPFDIESKRNTEIFLAYYDIFTRHCFGTYGDVLREVAYAPLMAEMLTYLESISSAYVWEREKRRTYADENFAREIMQLFTTGLVLLNLDGTPKIGADGGTIAVYDNEDILSYARGWTGFQRRQKRGNIEDYKTGSSTNKIDPLIIVPEWRDARPKTDLMGGYIGDAYPLCTDANQAKMFLCKGAKYQLLGGSSLPEYHKELRPRLDDAPIRIMKLYPTSSLYRILCQSNDSDDECMFANEVVLNDNLDCSGLECSLDTVQVVEVSPGIFYEYIAPPCVEMSFFQGGKVARYANGETNICANSYLPVAAEACCPPDGTRAQRSCKYSGEKLSYKGAAARCAEVGMISCSFSKVPSSSCDECCVEHSYHWTTEDCAVQVKIRSDGKVTLVHNAGEGQTLSHLSIDNKEYFRVLWKNGFPTASNGCGGSGSCRRVGSGDECLCDIVVTDEQIFYSMPSTKQALSSLFIGNLDRSSFDAGTYGEPIRGDDGVIAYHSRADDFAFGTSTIFEVHDDLKGRQFLKNVGSIVRIEGAEEYSFRNPPHFVSLFDPEPRDAYYETEAILQSYLRHPNTAPFLSLRFIQRFGLSNPSPRMIESVAFAFRQGTFTFTSTSGKSIEYGSGEYGSLAAIIAAIIMDPESRSVVLDADPVHGSLREPLMAIIAVMRSMEYTGKPGHELVKLFDVQERVGQEAHTFPTVFSFFLPHYSPSGPVASASLVAPESQLLAMSPVVAFLNGLFSLINHGLLSCAYGFGDKSSEGCSRLYPGDFSRSQGQLQYKPEATSPEGVVDELSTILTSGRLSDKSKSTIVDMYKRKQSKEAALRLAQELIITTPEFTSSGLVRSVNTERPAPASAIATSCRPYKALVFLMLNGACDSHNLLVPHSGCEDAGRAGKDLYAEYEQTRNYLALESESLLPIGANNTGQPCATFGLHPQLSAIRDLYNEESALFLANVGVLPKPFPEASQLGDIRTRLYSHEDMQREVKRIDIFRNSSGTGVLGRLTDVLTRSGIKAGSASLDRISEALIGKLGQSSSNMVINEKNIERFAPFPTSNFFTAAVRRLNEAMSWRSNILSETWSSVLWDSLTQNSIIYNTLESEETSENFPKSSLGRQLETVSRLISSRKCRGVERDVFYVEMGGWDTHDDMEDRLNDQFEELNEGLGSFVKEMRAQGEFENTVVVVSSDFGRTLTPNSRGGTDHAWGGQYFVLGGALKGKRILGRYPDDLTDNGPLNLGRGRLLPTMSWDQVWNGIAEWLGVAENDLDEVLPNRGNFASSLLSAEDLFIDIESNNETCSQEELNRMCKFDDEARGTNSYGESGITNMPVFLILIGGIVGLGCTVVFCWQRPDRRSEEVSGSDNVIL